MVADVLEGGSVSWPQRQAPLDKVLALWKSRGAPSEHRPLNWMYHFIYDKKLWNLLRSKVTCGDSPSEKDLTSCDLLVMFKGNVPTHHVIQQNAQGPHCGRAPVVPMVFDPLRGAVYSCPCWRKTTDSILKKQKNCHLTQKYNTHDKMRAFQGNQRSSHVTLFTNFTHSPKGGAKIEKRTCCYSSIYRLLPEGIHADAFIVDC